MDKKNLEELKIAELREIAKEKNIENVSKLKKSELIGEILKAEMTAEPLKEDVSYSDPVRKTNLMSGVLEVLADGYGFLRSENYESGENDVLCLKTR